MNDDTDAPSVNTSTSTIVGGERERAIGPSEHRLDYTQYPPGFRQQLVRAFERYRSEIIEATKHTPLETVEPEESESPRARRNVPTLFHLYVHKWREVVADMRRSTSPVIPEVIIQELLWIRTQVFELLRELNKDRRITDAMIDEIEWVDPQEEITRMNEEIIEDVKKVAKVILPDHRILNTNYRVVNVEDLFVLDDLPETPLKDDLKETLDRIHLPQRENLHKMIGEELAAKLTPGRLDGLEYAGYKGGVARLMLKLYCYKLALRGGDADAIAHAERLLRCELPLSDHDAVVAAEVDMWAVAARLNVDPDGIEKMPRTGPYYGVEIDIVEYLNSRDVDVNQCLLTGNLLYYTDEALLAARSGIIHCAGRAITLFGVDTFLYKDRRYFTNKILNRLIKMVVEGKADAFEMPYYNTDVQIGIYWLVLIRKVHEKTDRKRMIGQIFWCAQQLRQTTVKVRQPDGTEIAFETHTPKEFLERLSQRYPFFSFQKNQTRGQVARWILTKYTTLLFRYIKNKFEVHSDWEYTSEDNTSTTFRPDISAIPQEQLDEAGDFLTELVNRPPMDEQEFFQSLRNLGLEGEFE